MANNSFTLLLLTCAVTLTLAAFLVYVLLIPMNQTVPQWFASFALCWAIVGCIAGLTGSLMLAKRSSWWSLLAFPALVDAYMALAIAAGTGTAHMH
jgi:hypothetical protein